MRIKGGGQFRPGGLIRDVYAALDRAVDLRIQDLVRLATRQNPFWSLQVDLADMLNLRQTARNEIKPKDENQEAAPEGG